MPSIGAQGDAGIRLKSVQNGIEIGQEAAPAIFEIAAVTTLAQRGDVAFATDAEVLFKMQAYDAADTQRSAFCGIINGIQITLQIASMDHHTSVEALQEFLFLGRC